MTNELEPGVDSMGATLTTVPEGQLWLTRDGETLLLGTTPTAFAYQNGIATPADIQVQVEADGFLIEVSVPNAEAIEFRLELESGRHWYGLGELIHQHYPLERAAIPPTPFITWDNGITGVANILEPLWLTATGVGIWVPPGAETFTLSINAPQTKTPTSEWKPVLNVTRPAHERPFPVSEVGGDGLLTLRFEGSQARLHLIVGESLREAQQLFVARVGHPTTVPDVHHLIHPIWTTWARYKTDIHQERVLAFANEIQQAGFPIGTMEIDDRWQAAYGDLFFDSALFPDPKAMIDVLHAQNIQVTAWVMPFIAPTAACAAEATENHYLIRTPDGEPYQIMWWQGPGYLIDVSNPAALMWFRERLEQLKADTGLDGYKFDAGEACYLPPDARSMGMVNGNEYNRLYIEFLGEYFPSSDVRSGWRNQKTPLLFREWDKFSLWGLDNGLQSVLSQALVLGMLGYPFVLADMIGGNEYGDERTDAEMMIRWTQANALLPMIQFSVAPWDFDAEVSDLCRHAADLHVQFGAEFERVARESVETGYPMVRALVWAYGDDPETETIWDQFLLGDNWLVAPVVVMGGRSRDVYLPDGQWRMADTGELFEGQQWLRDVPVPLDRLLYFEKVG
jgi:myogenesis-regulating glycosidase